MIAYLSDFATDHRENRYKCDDERKVSDGQLTPVLLVSALISAGRPKQQREFQAALWPHTMPGISPKWLKKSHSQIYRPCPTRPPATQPMMSSMSLPASATAPSTFSVMHPLHCGPVAFRQQHQFSAVNTFVRTPTTMSLSQLASPTMTPRKSRTQPMASPNKKARKSRVVFDFTTEEMAQYFHMSQREAAQQLGVATVTIKRNCRRLGIVWPYRLMKSKKHAINWSAISREDALRIRQERALEQAKAGRSPSSRSNSCNRSPSAFRLNTASDDKAAAKVMTMLSHCSNVELTEAGLAFARLPLDCMDTLE
ncbi:unnamed protein product [Peronospora belbahrii]|uniref:RWP-RK domain-containing protein n=1 Tax=Peronospora belbahrii TaxID=622444 RepID=A0AAU9KNL1_9STRA|nr:unnamed protein product [Peronospora belbahrii]